MPRAKRICTIDRAPRSRARRRPCPRGSTYLAVLGISMLVSLLGASAIMVTRLQSRGSIAAGDVDEARAYARSAIEIGRALVNNDPNWRKDQTSGTWVTNQPLGSGSFSLSGTNPNDPKLNHNANDPLILTGTGYRGRAQQMLQVELDPFFISIDCLDVPLAVAGLGTLNITTINANGTISTNSNFAALISTINCPVESALLSTGSTYAKGTKILAAPRTYPTAATAFDYYTTNGAVISFGSIPVVSGTSTIDRTLLSPTNNPLGGGTNAEGIYVIDCKGSNIKITNTRVVGTLVLLNTGVSSAVQSSQVWEPAVPNYPILMVKGPFAIKATNTALAETGTPNVNFNPAGTPYPFVKGTSDANTTGSFASVMSGLIYISGNATTGSHPVINGALIIGGTLTTSGTLDLTYDHTYKKTPPPGFQSASQMLVKDGTWKQITN